MNYNRIPTTPEVWAVIKASHPDLKVFSSYSNPDGDDGLSYLCQMLTEYGFEGQDFPTLGARTTWEKSDDPQKPHARENEHHEYWLCVGFE